ILGGDEAAVSRGGYRVTTTLDMTKQEIGERQVKDWVEKLHNRNVWNAALVSIDPRTGEVLSYVGSADFHNRYEPRYPGHFNVPAVRFLAEYSGIEDTIQTAHDLGITTDIDPTKIGLSLTLGAKEVHLVDMASAYGVLANMGLRVTPTYILKVEDSRGKVVWEHKDYEQKRALDAGIAWIMTDILKDTTQPSKDFIFGSWTNIGRP